MDLQLTGTGAGPAQGRPAALTPLLPDGAPGASFSELWAALLADAGAGLATPVEGGQNEATSTAAALDGTADLFDAAGSITWPPAAAPEWPPAADHPLEDTMTLVDSEVTTLLGDAVLEAAPVDDTRAAAPVMDPRAAAPVVDPWAAVPVADPSVPVADVGAGVEARAKAVGTATGLGAVKPADHRPVSDVTDVAGIPATSGAVVQVDAGVSMARKETADDHAQGGGERRVILHADPPNAPAVAARAETAPLRDSAGTSSGIRPGAPAPADTAETPGDRAGRPAREPQQAAPGATLAGPPAVPQPRPLAFPAEVEPQSAPPEPLPTALPNQSLTGIVTESASEVISGGDTERAGARAHVRPAGPLHAETPPREMAAVVIGEGTPDHAAGDLAREASHAPLPPGAPDVRFPEPALAHVANQRVDPAPVEAPQHPPLSGAGHVGPAGAATAAAAYISTEVTLPESSGDVVVPQLVRAMRVLMKNGVGEMRLELEPRHLGAVSISVRVEHGLVSATVTAERPAVRQWVEAHEPSLRQGLAGHGLGLDRLRVQADEERGGGRQPQEPHQGSMPRRRMKQETATFELVA
jgi:hypothetical protein